jgi:inosine-uridine nucleoside N-ribohydrolase
VARLLEVFIETYPDAFVGEPHAPLHDPCAVLAVTHPHLFAWQDVHVAVELAGTLTRGMTVVDRRDHRSPEAANVEVARGVDARQVLAALTRAVAAVAGRATTPVETILSGSAEAGTGRRVEPGENGWPR